MIRKLTCGLGALGASLATATAVTFDDLESTTSAKPAKKAKPVTKTQKKATPVKA